MKKYYLLLFLFLASYSPLASMPLQKGFVQVDGLNFLSGEDVRYAASFKNYRIFLTHNRIIYTLDGQVKGRSTSYRADLIFPGSAEESLVMDPFPSPVHFIKESGITTSRTYEKVLFKNIRSGVDVEFIYKEEGLKYNIIYRETGKGLPSSIALKQKGFTHMEKIGSDFLLLRTPLGDLLESVPMVYGKDLSGKKLPLASNYNIDGEEVLLNYQPSSLIMSSVVVDPWTTYLGGAKIEEPSDIHIDCNGNVYVTGYTRSFDFPATPGSFQDTLNSNYDGFISCFDSLGSMNWSTYFGGSADEYPEFVEVSPAGQLFVSGYSTSSDMPVTGGGQDTLAGSYDGFVLVMDTSGTYQWSKYFGGPGGEFVLDAGLTSSGNMVIGGYTSSSSLPGISGGWQTGNAGALDIFLSVLDKSGQVKWTTFYGGTNTEDVHGIYIDGNGDILVTGETYSSDFPVSNGAYQNYNAGQLDVFLMRFDSLGNRKWATYFGGSSDEDANGLQVNSNGDIFLAGYSKSNDFPILGNSPYQVSKGAGKDVMMVKFNSFGTPLLSTFMGGNSTDEARDITLISDSLFWIAGNTNSSDFPLMGNTIQQNNSGGTDGFFVKVDSSLKPKYSTYFGGTSNEYVFGASACSNLLALTGQSYSSDLPVTSGAFDATYHANGDGFVALFDTLASPVVVTGLRKNEKAKEKTQMHLYPNPATNYITLEFSHSQLQNDGSGAILLINEEGKVIQIFEEVFFGEKMKVDIRDFSPGLYSAIILENKGISNSSQFLVIP